MVLQKDLLMKMKKCTKISQFSHLTETKNTNTTINFSEKGLGTW